MPIISTCWHGTILIHRYLILMPALAATSACSQHVTWRAISGEENIFPCWGYIWHYLQIISLSPSPGNYPHKWKFPLRICENSGCPYDIAWFGLRYPCHQLSNWMRFFFLIVIKSILSNAQGMPQGIQNLSLSYHLKHVSATLMIAASKNDALNVRAHSSGTC